MQLDEVRVALFDVCDRFDVVDSLHYDFKEPSAFFFPFLGDTQLYSCIHLFCFKLLIR